VSCEYADARGDNPPTIPELLCCCLSGLSLFLKESDSSEEFVDPPPPLVFSASYPSPPFQSPPPFPRVFFPGYTKLGGIIGTGGTASPPVNAKNGDSSGRVAESALPVRVVITELRSGCNRNPNEKRNSSLDASVRVSSPSTPAITEEEEEAWEGRREIDRGTGAWAAAWAVFVV
jgi:hypothetical protein